MPSPAGPDSPASEDDQSVAAIAGAPTLPIPPSSTTSDTTFSPGLQNELERAYAQTSRRGVWALNTLLALTIMAYVGCYLLANFGESFHFVFFFGILVEVAALVRWRQLRGLSGHDYFDPMAARTVGAARRAAARRRAADEEIGIHDGVALPMYRVEAGPDEQCFPDIEMPPPNYNGGAEGDERGGASAERTREEESRETRTAVAGPPPEYWVAIAGLTEGEGDNEGADELRRGSVISAPDSAIVMDMPSESESERGERLSS